MNELMQYRDLVWDIYEHTKELQLKLWYAIDCVQSDLEWRDELDPEKKLVEAEAVYDKQNRVLKIVVNECLPRLSTLKYEPTSFLMRNFWKGCVAAAIRKLPEPVTFEKALCSIIIYTPRKIEWDVDNRAFQMIINALRASQVIKSDGWDTLALLLKGEVDKKRPRTEIIVKEYPEDTINALIKKV